MAIIEKRTRKRKSNRRSKPETPNKKTKQHEPEDSHRRHGSESDSDEETDSEKLANLLEAYSKDHLIGLICDAAGTDLSLAARVRALADRDTSHRKIFVHGFGWDTTTETLTSAFASFGEIEDCKVVVDRATGKAKGYGFVLFTTRKATIRALRAPQKKIGGRMASCQLASLGNSPAAPAGESPASQRKIYVSNVPADADVESFRELFARFGELEAGPIGFDVQTGKSRGFALFVYRNVEGFKKALQEPYKLFEGHQLHCQKAAEGKGKSSAAPAPHPMPIPAMAPQNMAMFNPMMYGMGGFGVGFVPGGAMNPMGMVPMGQFGAYGVGSSSVNPNAAAAPPAYLTPSKAQFGAGGGSSGAYKSSYVW